MLGNLATAASSVLLLIAVTRLCGASAAGVFSVAYATAQMLMMVGNYGVRAYQASDINEEFSFYEYLVIRILTCILMLAVGAIYVLLKQYNGETAYIMLLVCIYKMLDALADVYEGYLQQHDRLFWAGKSLFYRTVLSVLTFCATLLCSGSLVLACCLCCLVSLIILAILGIRPVVGLNRNRSINILKGLSILKKCFPLFLSLFLLAYIINIPRYSIEAFVSYEAQTYYNIIYMPAQVIYLLSAFAFKPLITNMTILWGSDKGKLGLWIKKLVLGIMVLTFFVALLAYLIGIPILNILYKVDVSYLKKELVLVVIGGGFNALASMCYHVLTVMRRQNAIIIAYLLVFAFAYTLGDMLVSDYLILGAVLCYCSSMLLLMALTLGMVKVFYHKQ